MREAEVLTEKLVSLGVKVTEVVHVNDSDGRLRDRVRLRVCDAESDRLLADADGETEGVRLPLLEALPLKLRGHGGAAVVRGRRGTERPVWAAGAGSGTT